MDSEKHGSQCFNKQTKKISKCSLSFISGKTFLMLGPIIQMSITQHKLCCGLKPFHVFLGALEMASHTAQPSEEAASKTYSSFFVSVSCAFLHKCTTAWFVHHTVLHDLFCLMEACWFCGCVCHFLASPRRQSSSVLKVARKDSLQRA